VLSQAAVKRITQSADRSKVSLLAAADPQQSAPPRDANPFAHRDLLEHVGMGVLLLFWAVFLTMSTGGPGVYAELAFVVMLVPLLIAIRAWKAPLGSALVAASVSAAALLVCEFAPTGWRGSPAAAGYVLASAVFLAARRYVRIDGRREFVAGAVCLAGSLEFAQGFARWVSGRQSVAAMVGTIEAHNEFAAFLLPGAVIGLGLFAQRRSPLHIIGLTSAVLCSAGIVFSSSRASMAVLIVAWLLMLASHARDPVKLRRMGGAVLFAAVFTAILPGPPLFSHYASPFAATAHRESDGESLDRNGTFRTEAWREAGEVVTHHPLVGGGYFGQAAASARYVPTDWLHTPLAFSGYFQPLSDGGLLLGLPFLSAVGIILFWALRRFLELLRARGRPAEDSVQVACTVALLAVLAHSAVDYDWTFPSLMIEAALVASCIAPAAGRRAREWLRYERVVSLALLVVTVALAVCVPALYQRRADQPNLFQAKLISLDSAGGQAGAGLLSVSLPPRQLHGGGRRNSPSPRWSWLDQTSAFRFRDLP
jgi:hypothetical protein